MTILIPAYKPDMKLLDLILNIKKICSYNIVIVDDGSGEKFKDIFIEAENLNCNVLIHEKNLGKGMALKTGFKFIKTSEENMGVVCADSDGQHLPEDIVRIAENIEEDTSVIILGSRHFVSNVPILSRIGNTLTRFIFSIATGTSIYDTQTGLRGYSFNMLDWLCSIPGERYEYEMNILLETQKSGYLFKEIDIDTVYYKKNKSSHFRTIRDSLRVYEPIIKFCASSLISAIIDLTLLFLIQLFTSNLLISVIASRVCSSIFNYSMNKNYVFYNGGESGFKSSLIKYFTLVIFVMAFNYLLIFTFNKLIGIPLFFSKLLTEATIFSFSYWTQRKYVFI